MEALYDTQRTTARKLAKEQPKATEDAAITLHIRIQDGGEDDGMTSTTMGSLREGVLSSMNVEAASVTSQWSATTQGLSSAIGAVRALRNPFAEVRGGEGTGGGCHHGGETETIEAGGVGVGGGGGGYSMRLPFRFHAECAATDWAGVDG